MWEKLSDDGSIHDKDDTYDFMAAFSSKIDGLNAASFAGHDDWRVPNLNELETLRRLGASPTVNAAFDSGCVGGCTITTCSCTATAEYWTSTSYGLAPATSFAVSFAGGLVSNPSKAATLSVRAVRDAG